jgi:GNAT superfamily N-acetyltransferase
MDKIEHLFRNMHDTLILSCLQGHMGDAWTDNMENPRLAIIQGGDFLFIAGDETAEQVETMIAQILDVTGLKRGFVIPEKKSLGDIVVKVYGEDCKIISRYAIKKKQDEFDFVKLQAMIDKLPQGYTLRPIEGEWYDEVIKEGWSEDFVSNFESKEDYERRGIGRIITHDGKVISGASSYTRYNEGIEIEISTKEEYRRQGFARIAGAALILACRQRGLYPSWDAANMMSVQLAEKLGYEFDKPYDTYMIRKQ